MTTGKQNVPAAGVRRLPMSKGFSGRVIILALCAAAMAACGSTGGSPSSSPTSPSPVSPAPSPTPGPAPAPAPPPAPAPAPSPTPAPTSGRITITSAGASPNPITIAVGGTVTFVNGDAVPHDVAGGADPLHRDCPEIDAVGFLTPGQTRQTQVFTRARTCEFHDHSFHSTIFNGRIIIQ